MEIMEIFELSQVSRRTLNYLNLARISVETVNIVNGSADKIMVFNRSCTERVFLIEFLKTPQPVVGQMKVNNIRIDVCSKDAARKIINCNSNQFGYGVVHILAHLNKIFYRMDIALGIEMTTLNAMRGILCYPIFRKCYYMQFRGENETLSNEDCEYLLEKAQPATGITIFCKLSPDFNYKKILHFSRLRVPNLGKMPLEDLKVLDSEIANLGNHQFTETDINEFLHHWIKGNSRKLRRLKLDGFKDTPDWDILLKDIVYTEWNPRERGRYYKSKYTVEVETIDCENGMDFRNKDGELATVVHHLEFLDFLIWNNRFPE
ncbi:hypothetical protein GCK72_000125 [Caenorhabditis remanei]|uniref:Sdz-33 F-box domain-containing protein n=1 Tax=Caenorhabditis remanei TaxID=31234 RepID=A0A6A5HPX4_CAERE|nr:hypothetical protein GCK72_000125 [Caenorhabditis remanei]KAF1768313.1 hypothetical protein GCK72_000125 [Caenorhabditis remanei]